MITEETLLNIKSSCSEFAEMMKEKYDLDYFDVDEINHNGYKFQAKFNGTVKAPGTDRDKVIYALAKYNLPYTIIDENFVFGGKELRIVDVQIHNKPIIAMDVMKKEDRYRFTVKQIREIFKTHLLNAMAGVNTIAKDNAEVEVSTVEETNTK